MMTHQPRHYDWAAGLYILACGLVLLLPGHTFAYSPAYVSLTQYAPETTWGLLWTIVGLARIAALIVNGRAPRGSPILRALTALVGAATWSMVGAGFIVYSISSGIPSLGCSWLILGLLDLAATMRAAVDAARGHQLLIARKQAYGQRRV